MRERERIVRATQAVERKTCIHFRIINSGYLPNHLGANRPLQFHNSINIYLVPSICLSLIHNWIICNPSTQKLNLVGEIYEYIKNTLIQSSQRPLTLKMGKKWYMGGLKKSENMEPLGFLWQWAKAALLFLEHSGLHFGAVVFKWMLTFLKCHPITSSYQHTHK